MPSPQEFIKAYGFRNNMEIDGYNLNKIIIDHNVIKRYREYKYNIKLYFENNYENSNLNNLKKIVREMFSKTKIIKSNYGNPYECSVKDIQFINNIQRNTINVIAVGYGERIFYE